MADTPPVCPRQPYALLSVIAGVLSTPTLLTTPRIAGRTPYAELQAGHSGEGATRAQNDLADLSQYV